MNRKAIFALPNIIINENINLENNLVLRKTKKTDCSILGEYNLDNLTVLETDFFKSCNLYDKNFHIKILDIISKLKFTYFFKHTASGHGYPGFISEEAFDLFVLLEKNQDNSFEHKIPITNGLTTYLMSLDEYYKYKNIFGKITSLTLYKEVLSNFCFFHKFDDNNQLLAMDLYNKCRKISTLDDNFNRIIFARTSIEVVIKDVQLNKKNYVSSFINKSITLIEKNIKENSLLFSSYKDLNLEYIENSLNLYLINLTQERHNIVHDGKTNVNIPLEVYLVWFPLFFIISYDKIDIKIELDLTLRILFFLNLLNINPEVWNQIDSQNFNKKTCLYSYDESVNIIPRLIKENNLEYLEVYIKAFHNCIKEKANKSLERNI